MSGGYFDYAQYRIGDIVDGLKDYLDGEALDDEDVEVVLQDKFLNEEERQYIKNHHHTMPNRYGYSKETLKEMRKGLILLRKAEVYAQRIDWLLSGDDSEERFHERLKEDLQKEKELR